jgi:enoyl-CoA hydratase/carnithine racemase
MTAVGPPDAGSGRRVVTERRGPAFLIGLDRPDKRNAIDHETVDELHQVLDEAGRGDPCVVIVHSTTPGMFVAGADIAELIERRADDAFRAINAGLFERLEAHRWPTIAVVDGPALGGGCELALACDLRVASPQARFGQPELGLGIIAGAGGNWRLAQLVGLGWARRLLYLGEVVDVKTAQAIGLVDAVHPSEELLPAAIDLAGRIARQSWRALELTKLALRQQRQATTLFDVTAQALLFEGEDKRARMGAFLERRRSKPDTPDTPDASR